MIDPAHARKQELLPGEFAEAAPLQLPLVGIEREVLGETHPALFNGLVDHAEGDKGDDEDDLSFFHFPLFRYR